QGCAALASTVMRLSGRICKVGYYPIAGTFVNLMYVSSFIYGRFEELQTVVPIIAAGLRFRGLTRCNQMKLTRKYASHAAGERLPEQGQCGGPFLLACGGPKGQYPKTQETVRHL